MAENTTKKGLVIRKEKLGSLVFGLVSVLTLLIGWYKVDVLYVSFPLTVFNSMAGDISGLLGFTKVVGIIVFVIGILYVLAQIIDVEKFVPALKKFKFGFYRLFGLVYYGLLALTALFAIIGSIAADSVDPTVKLFFLFVIFGCAIVKFAIPKFYSKVAKVLKITVE